jgi:hypothetical protein
VNATKKKEKSSRCEYDLSFPPLSNNFPSIYIGKILTGTSTLICAECTNTFLVATVQTGSISMAEIDVRRVHFPTPYKNLV